MNKPEIKVGQKYRVVDVKGFGCPMGSRQGDILEIDYCKDTDPESWRASNPALDVRGEVIFYPEDITSGYVELVEDVQESHEDAPVFEQCQVWEITDDYNRDVRKGDCVYISTAEILFGDTEAVAHNITNTDATVILYESDVINGRIKKVTDSLYEYFTGEPLGASGAIPELPCSEAPETPENVSQTSTGGSTGMSGELLWKFITGSSTHNSHFQMELGELSIESLKDSVIGLGDYLEQDRDTLASSLEIRLMYNGDFGGKFSGTWSASVYQLDYWGLEEHPSGHTDRLLFGVEIVRGI